MDMASGHKDALEVSQEVATPMNKKSYFAMRSLFHATDGLTIPESWQETQETHPNGLFLPESLVQMNLNTGL